MLRLPQIYVQGKMLLLTYSAFSLALGSATSVPGGPLNASSISPVVSSLANSIPVVGAVWVLSSAIFTTYSSTAFLKYTPSSVEDRIDEELGFSTSLEIHRESKSCSSVREKTAKTYSSSPSFPRIGSVADRSTYRRKPGSDSSSAMNDVIKDSRSRNISNPRALPSIGLSASTLLTLYRFAGSMMLGLIVPNPSKLAVKVEETLPLIPHFLIAAVFMFTANYSNSFALDRVGIPLTYTSKCGIPLVTVLISIFMYGAKACPNFPTLMSLAVIAFGIGCASWSSPSFEVVGFGAAVLSCVSQSALTLASKNAIEVTDASGIDAQRTLVTISTAFMVILLIGRTLLKEFGKLFNTIRMKPATAGPTNDHQSSLSSGSAQTSVRRPFWLISLTIVAYHVEYIVSFMFVRLVDPVTYGTCDAIRRLCIIVCGRIMFGGIPFSKTNKIGISLSVLGAIAYSIVNS